MPISKEEKQKYVDQFGKGTGDTGAPEVQIAILTHRIRELTDHVRTHKKRSSYPQRIGTISIKKKENAQVLNTC